MAECSDSTQKRGSDNSIQSKVIPQAGAPGESNTASNVGGGFGVFKQKTGVDLEFKSLIAGPNITITQTADTIEFEASATSLANVMFDNVDNFMSLSSGILFNQISDTSSEVDSFRLPSIDNVPSSNPTNSGAGYLLWCEPNLSLYAWTGLQWLNLTDSENHIYDNSISGLTATKTQGAIDELKTLIDDNTDLIELTNFSYFLVDFAVNLVIPDTRQMVVADSITVNGSITVDGELAIV